jgi:acyl-CoA thioester hydrolase
VAHICTRRLDVEVEFHQVDMMQVVHNSEYFRWFEKGRLALLEEVLPMRWMIENRIGAPVVLNHCEYLWPAVFGDRLACTTRHRLLERYEGRLEFEHSIVRYRGKLELAGGRTAIALVDLDRRRLVRELPGEIWDRYRGLR